MHIAGRRLRNQRLLGNGFETAAEVVRWFGAVQAQDYLGATWGLAQRTGGLDSAALNRAFDTGEFLRTHAMRPTWHFIAPEDIRWLLALTGPRVLAGMASRMRQLELDEATLSRSDEVLVSALQDGRARDRRDLGQVLKAAGIAPDGQRLPYLLTHAELTSTVCSGPILGKQQTYALLDDRVPPAPPLSRDEAVTRLVQRYFTSHGPATLQDFAWWSGLTIGDGKRGLEALGSDVEPAVVDGKTYWLSGAGPDEAPGSAAAPASPVVHLLPNYDEHVVAYRDHGPSIHPDARGKVTERIDLVVGPHSIVVDGLIVGGWRRAVGPKAATVEANPLVPLDPEARRGVAAAVERFSRFLGRPVELAWPG